jgi:ubiquinone biosynthesis protein COQ9
MTVEVEKKFQEKRNRFIDKVHELLSFYEWDMQLIKQVEDECGFMQGYASILYPGEIGEIVTAYETLQDRKMLELLKACEVPLKVREKISKALKVRIKACSSKVILKKNQRFLCKPDNLMLTAKLAWASCDVIWRYAGDNSTDFNHYSKRGLLVAVYLSSITFYINDESEGFIETDNFIDTNLERIINISNFKNIITLPKLEDIPILRLFS